MCDANHIPVFTVGVLADTHIPDRVINLHPEVIPTLQAARVEMILHAGDICMQNVIRGLEKVAPVLVVRGNRDIFYSNIPLVETMEIAGVPVSLMHGHGNLLRYAWDKIHFLIHGYQLEHYLPVLTRTSTNAKVIVFGHTHHPVCLWREGKLLFNPGSAGLGWNRDIPPSIGVLRFYENEKVDGEIIFLEKGYRKNMKWHPDISPLKN